MRYMGITFDDDKHTYDDFGMRIKSINIGLPSVKKSTINVNGTNGVLDLTDYFGTKYENRKITIVGDIEDKSYQNWSRNISSIANYLQGKKRKLVLDWDFGYYYIGRCSLEVDKKNKLYGEITLVFDCEPYKYELTDTGTDWLWNPFDLNDGVIREYKEMSVSGTLRMTLVGSFMPVVPVIITSSDMQVSFEGETYDLYTGENYIPDIEIVEGEQEIIFSGTGTVSVIYKVGSL